tara:strand:+ start:442 stop:636 length:195 start_codon:yes stop_codon:yes gene_type:complete
MEFTADQKHALGLIFQALNKKENEQIKNFVLRRLRSQLVAVGVKRLRKRKLASGETRRLKLPVH